MNPLFQRFFTLERDERLEILKGLPKVELHRHLEGALRIGTMLELGRKYNLSLPLKDVSSLLKMVAYNDGEPRTLAHFLTKFRSDWYRSYQDIERVAGEAVADAAGEGIVHLELRFSPEHFTRTSKLELQGVMQAVCESASAAASDAGIGVGFILTFTRERYDFPVWKKIVDLGAEMWESGVAGVDLAGDEFNHPNNEFQKIFQRVVDTGALGATIHAGEGTTAGQVASAVEVLGARRIGHGLKAAEDPAVVQLLAGREVALEMCPISNYQTGCVNDLQQHPLPQLDRSSVAVTINADDPGIHRSTINDDYDVAVTRWGYTLDDLLRLELNAVRAAFLPDDRREELRRRIEGGYAESRGQGLK
jgi:adenosine deaminase